MRILNPFHKPAAATMAALELEEAQRQLLSAAASREYYSAMENMLYRRIERLTAVVTRETDKCK